jgi:hypothetical protein
VDVDDETMISALLVDNMQVVPETSAPVSLLFLGTVGAVAVAKHRNKKYNQ